LRVMARPRPVPPKRRAVAASAWLNSESKNVTPKEASGKMLQSDLSSSYFH
jgi:hypothetical protein